MLAIIFSLYILLKPFYLWSSGLPQAADLFLLFGFIILPLYGVKNNLSSCFYDKKLKLILFFLLYAIFINLSMSLFEQDNRIALSAFFYIFNFLFVILLVLVVTQSKVTVSDVITLHLVIILMLFLMSFLYPESQMRRSLTFNNPNQLAAFVILICLACSYIVIRNFNNIMLLDKLKFIFSMLLGLYLVFITLSFGAFLAIPIILFYIAYRFYKKTFFILTVTSILVIPSLVTFFLLKNDSLTQRVIKKETAQHSFWEERGYDRIYNNYEYLIFGAGEGAVDRFDSYLVNEEHQSELHSVIGTLLFCYGIVGLFLIIFYFVLIRKDTDFLVILLALSPYLLTHNLLRQPCFFMLLVLPSIVKYILLDKKKGWF
ncbi:Conserved hypothetical protein [Shewanella piezotolerans WP3]|uniref:O-antigen polymerase n=1 Tax=Shewanella piezotolerans (strain WP3 / JCM 13877) TaxID=225849 RepID=B8CL34_SHEPW|nr:hypothetical protein [Shewanella piezotolerans]ACJ28360.1 Conserved hypothetical protein [Shewanella piezotolerans WP3]